MTCAPACGVRPARGLGRPSVTSPRAAPWPAAPSRPGARWSRRQTAGSAAAAGSAPCLRGARRRFSAPALESRSAQARAAAQSAPVMSRPMAAGLRASGRKAQSARRRARVIRRRPTSPRHHQEKSNRHVRELCSRQRRAAGTQRPPDVACQRYASAHARPRRRTAAAHNATARLRTASKQRGANGARPSSQQW